MQARHRIGVAGLLIVVVVFAAGCPEWVFFEDKALESAVRAALGKPFGYLTQEDLLKVRDLDARGLGIQSLSGIEYCLNLESLDLDTNQISSLKPLEQLGRPESPFDSTLGFLNLDGNQISDLTPLAGLFNLYGLSLFNNQVADIGPLVTNAANGGIGHGTYVILDQDTLGQQALTVDVPQLEDYGVEVHFVVPAGDTTEGS